MSKVTLLGEGLENNEAALISKRPPDRFSIMSPNYGNLGFIFVSSQEVETTGQMAVKDTEEDASVI